MCISEFGKSELDIIVLYYSLYKAKTLQTPP